MRQNRCLILFVFLIFGHSYAQNNLFPLQHYTIESGLSHDKITSIVKDQEGFMWFGTHNGLNRFDGLHFEVINPIPESSLFTTIHHFAQDRDGWFWLVTNDGLIRFHPKTRQYKQVFLRDDWSTQAIGSQIYRIHLSDRGHAWFATQKHLYKINLKTQQYQFFKMPFWASRLFFGALEDSKGRVWVQISTALYRFEEKTRKFKYYYGIDDLHTDPKQNFTGIPFEDSAGQLWLPNWYDYPRVYDERSDSFVVRGKQKSVNNIYLEDITEEGRKFLWAAGGNTGLQILWLDDLSFELIEHDSCKPYTHNMRPVNCLFKDEAANIIWIGTDKGIEKYDRFMARFKRNPVFEKGRAKIHGEITQILQDKNQDHIFWLSVWGDGLYRWNRKTNELQYFNQKNTPMPDPALFDATQQADGSLWLAAGGGFYQYDPRNNTWKIFRDFFKRTKSVNNVLNIFKDEHRDRVWIGCNHEGLWYLEKGARSPTRWYFPDIPPEDRHFITKIQSDKQGNIWISSHSGLHKINVEKKTTEKIFLGVYGRHKTAINSFFISKDQHIWLTGVDFLMKLDKNGKYLESFNLQENFRSHPFDLVEDKQGCLWIGSDNGLHKFYPQTKKFKTFHKDEGLIDNAVNGDLSICKNGEIFLAFTGGEFNFFHPDLIQYNLQKPSIAFTGILVNNQKRVIDFNQPLILHPQENIIHFNFVALNYSLTHKNKFAYQMKGFDEKWTYTDQPNANYTNLDEGTYTFRVIAANNDAVWNEQGTALQIVVLAPFYRTWWFRIVLLLMLSAVMYGLFSYRQNQRKKIDAFRNRIAKDLHDDMGSTLSSIRIISDVLRQQIKDAHPQSEKMLQRISQGAASLSDAMQDIIWSIKTDFDTLEDMLARMRAFALKLLEAKQIAFKTRISQDFENTHLNIEQRRNIYLIFKEAVNNAAKYAECREVELIIEMEKKQFGMIVQDNGKGFDPEKISLGNGLQNMQKRAAELKGICLIRSQIGQGTRVELKLKL